MTEIIFDKALNILFENEGGYVNDPDDPGGETKFGISKRSYPDIDIKNLTQEQAKRIYRRDFWKPCACDRYPDALSVAVLDYAVHSGKRRAIKDFQRSLGVVVDGISGSQTIGAANRLPPRPVFESYMNKRLNFLMSLKNWKKYGDGWGKRIKHVKEFCEGIL